ncbi:MAG: hypothetical protein RIB84_00045 [Sneathiellaceae bacterium]
MTAGPAGSAPPPADDDTEPRVSVTLDERSFARPGGGPSGISPLGHLALVGTPEGFLRIEAGFANPEAGADPLFAVIHRDEAEALFRLMVDAYFRGLDEVVAEELVALKLRFGVTGFEISVRRDGVERALNCPPSAMMRIAHGLGRVLDRMAARDSDAAAKGAGPPAPGQPAPDQPPPDQP